MQIFNDFGPNFVLEECLPKFSGFCQGRKSGNFFIWVFLVNWLSLIEFESQKNYWDTIWKVHLRASKWPYKKMDFWNCKSSFWYLKLEGNFFLPQFEGLKKGLGGRLKIMAFISTYRGEQQLSETYSLFLLRRPQVLQTGQKPKTVPKSNGNFATF